MSSGQKKNAPALDTTTVSGSIEKENAVSRRSNTGKETNKVTASSVVAIPTADGTALPTNSGPSQGYLADIAVKTAYSGQLNVYDGTSNTGVHLASIPAGSVGNFRIARMFKSGNLYFEHTAGGVGTFGLGS